MSNEESLPEGSPAKDQGVPERSLTPEEQKATESLYRVVNNEDGIAVPDDPQEGDRRLIEEFDDPS